MEQSSTGRRARTTVTVLGLLVVVTPIPVGLVLAWQVHPVLAVPAYLLGIPVYLSVLIWAGGGLRRLLGRTRSRTQQITRSKSTGSRSSGKKSASGADSDIRTATP
ncbi:hypothetical protein [Nocardioides acrostichi]|uniref:Uncharacterized protein n=1 Tax=Nocardioides acrostichi TaxID=2784339 RepID=A0A930UX35_9ACTN|nr:hypothetical protein [Nocardioides acrostichi]MBF4161726.1 hypothetical protein [Nocardioides acrostichi]